MKKIISILLTVLIVFSVLCIGVNAATVYTSGSYEYTISGSNATITKYNGSASNVTIPSTLDGKTVVCINNLAFTNNSYLTSVTIPSTVTTITTAGSVEHGAFRNCTKLKTVTIAEGKFDATIGNGTFRDCSSLTSITIPKNYVSIGDRAFSGCSQLKSLTIKESYYGYPVQTIGQYAFECCRALATISLPKTLRIINGYAFNECDSITTLNIPEGVEKIDNLAFGNCDNLTSVTIPSTVTTITTAGSVEHGAFRNCTKLKTITIAEGKLDATIGNGTFRDCVNLTIIHVPSNYKSIGDKAFYNCSNVTICNTTSSCYAKTYANQNGIPFKVCSGHGTPATTKYTVNFNANGGTVSPTNVTVGEGISMFLPTPTKSGYTCLGWSTSSAATSASYPCGTSYTPKANTTLYAVWKKSAEPIVMNVELNYKSNVKTVINGFNAEKYSSDNSDIAAVSSDGTITGTGRGSTAIHAYDKSGNEAKINVTVNYAWWQWIIKIVLFGWIWY